MKIAVGLSGGVDSAATAYHLLREGHDVIGLTMSVFDHQHSEIQTAAHVAEKLNIPHYIIDLKDVFRREVIRPFIDAYESGQTPNPCLLCNRSVKFEALMDAARDLGAAHFATGHYVRRTVDPETGTIQLLRARNARKDQSYNLYHLTQDQLRFLRFPLGEAEDKEAVRASVSELLPSLSKKRDSLGICFIPSKNHLTFLASLNSLAVRPGKIVTQSGDFLGMHSGIAGFTIGQKRGLPDTAKGRVVIGFCPEKCEVIVGSESDLLYHTLEIPKFHCIDPSKQAQLQASPLRVTVRTSQWSAPYAGTLRLSGDAGDTAFVQFDEGTRAPAPGQALVCYEGDLLVGGGQLV
ncbi:MAG: tRNA-uridine 2-sulfurtransferase [Clostridiales bacterium]|nr:tRNA-uridine 2-sulfurtransferase [Clostridiales bacterium]